MRQSGPDDAALDAAYSINGAEDCRRVYGIWSETYDDGFARDMDYDLPAHVAAAFLRAGGTGPILDVGAGTGLLAAALRGQGCAAPIDGLDISPEMLDRARPKGLYRQLVEADVTRPLPLPGPYAGIVSSGTFTHGHVGPDALPHLIAAAAPGALFALSVNAGVWQARGFDAALAAMPGLSLAEVPVYGPAAARQGAAHAADRALIALFRRP